jgi:hypothetical protein
MLALSRRIPTADSSMRAGEWRGEFYTYEADGVRLRDWFADLVEGKPVDNVTCVACDEPGLYTP